MNARKVGAGFVLLLLSLPLPPAVALADDDDELHRVSFSVQVGRETQNDLASAVMAVEKENADPAALAQDVNRTMAAALKQAKAQSGVTVRSGNYRSYPVQQDGRIVRWHAEQELILESGDAAKLHGLLGALQEKLLLRGLNYTVSPEQSSKLEEGLTADALDAFKARATLIAERLGAKGYDIVQLNLDGAAQPPMPMMRTMAMRAEAALPVAGEPGTSRITSGVQAVIRLKY
jgi:predicted secreted protein